MIIRPAHEADIDGMLELLHNHMNAKFSKDRWRRLFTYDWCPDKPDYGRVAIHNGEIVGCIAAVYSDRWIDGKCERIVNPAAWYLRKDSRRLKSSLGQGVGLGLIADLTSDPDRHYHINTSSKNTLALLRRIGFEVLDNAKYVWRIEAAKTQREAANNVRCFTDRAAILAAIPQRERSIVDDHADLAVMPVVVEAGDASALIMFADEIKGAAAERWLDVLYVSDPTFFAQHADAIAAYMLTAPSMVIAADCRFCAGSPSTAERVPLEVARYVKSQNLGGHHIDHLYSEIQLLDQKLR